MSTSESGAKKVHRVIVDRSRCCGYGLCAQLCPTVYKLDADGLVYLDSDIVPEGEEENAVEGCKACPAEAIEVVIEG